MRFKISGSIMTGEHNKCYLRSFLIAYIYKKRSCEIQFLKIIVYSYAVLDKVGQSYKFVFPSKNAEYETLKVADGHFHWLLNYWKLSRSETESCLWKKNPEKHENHSMTIRNTIEDINWPYKFMADRFSILWT